MYRTLGNSEDVPEIRRIYCPIHRNPWNVRRWSSCGILMPWHRCGRSNDAVVSLAEKASWKTISIQFFLVACYPLVKVYIAIWNSWPSRKSWISHFFNGGSFQFVVCKRLPGRVPCFHSQFHSWRIPQLWFAPCLEAMDLQLSRSDPGPLLELKGHDLRKSAHLLRKLWQKHLKLGDTEFIGFIELKKIDDIDNIDIYWWISSPLYCDEKSYLGCPEIEWFGNPTSLLQQPSKNGEVVMGPMC